MMKFYNKCVCCGEKIEVFPEAYDCLEDLDVPMVCSEECNEKMNNIIKCTHCNSKNVISCDYNDDYVLFECQDCRKAFSVKDNSHLDYIIQIKEV